MPFSSNLSDKLLRWRHMTACLEQAKKAKQKNKTNKDAALFFIA
jgi:hypothetical protein